MKFFIRAPAVAVLVNKFEHLFNAHLVDFLKILQHKSAFKIISHLVAGNYTFCVEGDFKKSFPLLSYKFPNIDTSDAICFGI